MAKKTNVRKPFARVPAPLLISAAYGIMTLGKITKRSFTGIHPDRVKKVMLSTNVSGEKLSKSGFSLEYDLEEGIKDWFDDCGGRLA